MGYQKYTLMGYDKPYKFRSQVVKEQKEVKTKEFKAEIDTKTEIEYLREKYFDISGKDADKRWKEERLKEEISKL